MTTQASVLLSAVLAGTVLLAVAARAPGRPQSSAEAVQTEPAPASRVALGAGLLLPAPPPMPAAAVARMTKAAVMPPDDRSTAARPVDVAAALPQAAAPFGDASGREQGRTLLRLLEHGQGPVIELVWPQDQAGRERLHRKLTRCHGLRIAVTDDGGALYTLDEPPGQAWVPDLDRLSGYVRAPSGAAPLSERTAAEAIRRRHALPATAATVRLFPRRVDAELLAGLRALIGQGYRDTRIIRGRYTIGSGDVLVRDLNVDGQPVPGLISLTSDARCRA